MMGMKKQERRKGSVMHKSQLQEYAQKAAILPPVYDFVKEGASHEPRFKCIVTLNGVSYESAPGFPNLKSAEHAAAKVALDALQQNTDGTGVSPSPVHESGLCKNLLQEYAQKNSLPLPVYQSTRAGEDHAPTFTSSVEIAGVKYSGGSAKNKKEAEIKAAKTALLAIQSALASTVEAEVPVASLAKPQVGLSTFIDSQINSTGRKRGRGAQVFAEENAARKLKMEDTVTKISSEASAVATLATVVAPPAQVFAEENTVRQEKMEDTATKMSSEVSAVATPHLSPHIFPHTPAMAVAEESTPVTASTTEPMKSPKNEAAAAHEIPAVKEEAADGEPADPAETETSAVTTPTVSSNVAIADLLATPTAQKILGVL